MIYFVTGGSRGIGRAIVLDAVKAGHDVAFTYVNNTSKAEETVNLAKEVDPERKVKGYKLDVKDPDQVEEVGDQVLDDFDTVHVVVNNAGVNRDNLLATMSDEEWFEVINTNLTGPFYVARKFMTTLMSNKFGRIINISSLVADGGTGQCNYAAAKAGLHGLTKTIAKEYGRKNITCNALVPGFFDTDMTQETMPEAIKQFWKTYCPRPKGRMGELSEISSVVNFLATDGSGFINGQLIYLTGGLDWGP